MSKLVLLLSGFIFTAVATSLNCVEREVKSNKWLEIKRFTSREGTLLFYPGQTFHGVTISVTVHENKALNISKEDMCITTERWYMIEVTVTWDGNWNQKCKFQVNNCSGTCGTVRDMAYDNFQGFSVTARGGSFWSVNHTRQQTKCANPSARETNSTSFTTTDIFKSLVPKQRVVRLTWPVAVVCVAGIVLGLAGVVTILCKTARFRLGRQQRRDDAPSSGSPPDGDEEGVYICTNSLYEPFDAFTDTSMRRQQRRDDAPSSGSPPEGDEEGVYICTNSLYEPFDAFTDTSLGRQQWRNDAPSSGSPPKGDEEGVYICTNSLYEPFDAFTDTR